jgi:hypothetical protein
MKRRILYTTSAGNLTGTGKGEEESLGVASQKEQPLSIVHITASFNHKRNENKASFHKRNENKQQLRQDNLHIFYCSKYTSTGRTCKSNIWMVSQKCNQATKESKRLSATYSNHNASLMTNYTPFGHPVHICVGPLYNVYASQMMLEPQG